MKLPQLATSMMQPTPIQWSEILLNYKTATLTKQSNSRSPKVFKHNHITCRGHFSGNLTATKIETQTKDTLQILCENYTEIFSKHTTDIGKVDLVQRTLKPKIDIKLFDEKPYTLPICHHAWLRQELTDLDNAGISPCFSNFESPVITVSKKKCCSTHDIS